MYKQYVKLFEGEMTQFQRGKFTIWVVLQEGEATVHYPNRNSFSMGLASFSRINNSNLNQSIKRQRKGSWRVGVWSCQQIQAKGEKSAFFFVMTKASSLICLDRSVFSCLAE